MENIKLEYQVPIISSTQNDNEFIIQGVAINATTTRNGHVFLAEELEKSAKTLKNRPLLKDHNNSVDSVVGKVTKNVSFDKTKKCVLFEANVKDPVMQQKISDGLIETVSVGAIVSSVEESEDGRTEILRGIEFLELSLVAIPADKGATFATAIAESLQSNEPKIKIEVKSKMTDDIKDLEKENVSLKQELEKYKKQELAQKEVETKQALKAELKKEILNELTKQESEEEPEEKPEEESEAKPEEESEAESEEESEEKPEEESEAKPEDESEVKGEEKMKGKVTNESNEKEETNDSLMFERAGNSITVFETVIDNPVFKRE